MKEDTDPFKASFLPLSIEVHDKKFTAKLFDERHTFLFHINRMPYLILIYCLKSFMMWSVQKFYILRE